MVAYVASVSKNLAKGTKLGGELPTSPRLRAVSLFLESPWERTQNKYACERDCERDVEALMPRAANSVGVARLPTPTLLAARGITAPTSRSQSRSHAYFFCVLSYEFSRKRETARSLNCIHVQRSFKLAGISWLVSMKLLFEKKVRLNMFIPIIY